jgi:hypothetical protein
MRAGFRERLGLWLERLGFLDAVLLRYDGEAPRGRRRYVNRVSRHVVVR